MKKIFILFTIVFLTACSGKVVKPGEIPLATLPPSAEVESTRYSVSQGLNEEGTKVVQSGKSYTRVKNIMNKLLPVVGLPKNSLPVLIATTGDPNAGIYDGKTVVVYESLVSKLKDDNQLAAVLAHELGHAVAKHHDDTGEQDRESNLSIGSSILGGVASAATSYATGSSALGSSAGDLTQTATVAVGYGAYVKAYSRSQEREADDLGLNIMTKAGYDPQGAVEVWKNGDVIFGESGGFYSTHPGHQDRAKRLEKRVPLVVSAINGDKIKK